MPMPAWLILLARNDKFAAPDGEPQTLDNDLVITPGP